jgi:hypothetical protein
MVIMVGARHSFVMLTLDDCIALSDLTLEEIDAIAEHEHLPGMIAVELGCYLVHFPNGRQAIRSMIRDDIEAARARGDLRHSAELKVVLQDFVEHCRRNPALCGRWNEPSGRYR